MSDFETIAFIASVLFGLKCWVPWYRDILLVNPLRISNRAKYLLLATPVLCLALLMICVSTLSAATVRADGAYIAFYIAVGAAWLGGIAMVFPILGISARDDVLERGNTAASWPVAGALVGACCAFAGANIGDGPGVEVVVFSAALSSAFFIAIWLLVERLTAISEAITVDRDTGAGIRMGGFLIAVGLISGRSVAGDWVSVTATLRDLVFYAWPAIGLALLAVFVERVKAHKRSPSRIKASVLIAVIYVCVALGWLIVTGTAS